MIASLLLAALITTVPLLIAVIVAVLAPSTERRADARKVIELLRTRPNRDAIENPEDPSPPASRHRAL